MRPAAAQVAAQPRSAQTPMDGVPVANDNDDQQKDSDKQQSSRLSRVDRVAVMFSKGIAVRFREDHEHIVRRAEDSDEDSKSGVWESRLGCVTEFLGRRFGAKLLQVSPVRAHSHFNQQRHGQLVRPFHVLSNQRPHHLDFIFRHFKHQFVVHL